MLQFTTSITAEKNFNVQYLSFYISTKFHLIIQQESFCIKKLIN